MPYIWAENPGVYPRVRGGTFWGWAKLTAPVRDVGRTKPIEKCLDGGERATFERSLTTQEMRFRNDAEIREI